MRRSTRGVQFPTCFAVLLNSARLLVQVTFALIAWLTAVQTIFAESAPVVELAMFKPAVLGVSYALLPITIHGANARDAKVVQLQYCGPTAAAYQGTGIAVAVPSTSKVDRAFYLLESACTQTLAAIALQAKHQLGDAATWASALRLELRWAPWALTIRVLDAAGSDGAPATDLVLAHPIASYETNNVTTAEIASPLKAAIAFDQNGILIRLYEDQSAEIGGAMFPPIREGAEAFARFSFPYLTRILAARPQDIPIDALGGAAAHIGVSNIGPGSAPGSLRIQGSVSAKGASGTYVIDFDRVPSDLRFSHFSLSPQLANCPQLPDLQSRLACNAQNTIVKQLATKAVKAIENQLKNRPFRPVSPQKRYPVVLGSKAQTVQIETNSAAAETQWLDLWVRFYLEAAK